MSRGKMMRNPRSSGVYCQCCNDWTAIDFRTREKREWQAEAWEEGYLAGSVDMWADESLGVNPYKEKQE